MNADNMVKVGNGMFAAGCGFMLLFWVIIPILVLFVLFVLSAAGVLE